MYVSQNDISDSGTLSSGLRTKASLKQLTSPQIDNPIIDDDDDDNIESHTMHVDYLGKAGLLSSANRSIANGITPAQQPYVDRAINEDNGHCFDDVDDDPILLNDLFNENSGLDDSFSDLSNYNATTKPSDIEQLIDELETTLN